MLAQFHKILIVFTILLIVLSGAALLGSQTVFAQGGETDFIDSCDPNFDSDGDGNPDINPDCNPPTLQQIEFIVVRVLYAAWGFGGLGWGGYLIFIGTRFFSGDPQKIEEAKKRITMWIVGIFLFFLAVPILSTLMGILVNDSSVCFQELTDPGFTFFFRDVCT